LLFRKNVNDTLSLRVIFYIKDFELDITNKQNKTIIKRNVNLEPKIMQKLKDFYYNYTSEKMKNQPAKFYNAKNFTTKNFSSSENTNLSKDNQSIIEILPIPNDFFLLNLNKPIDNTCYYLKEAGIIQEVESEGNDIEDEIIDVEKLKNIDLTKCFFNQPSQIDLGRQPGDLTLSETLERRSKSLTQFIKNLRK
jgi:hypothetical protein